VDAYALLSQVPLFREVGGPALARLAARCVWRTYPAGQLLFSKGDEYRGSWVVGSGRVRVFRTSPEGREQVLHTEGPGRIVAEVPLFDGGPYPASAVTEEGSVLLYLAREEFEAFYRQNPDVAQAIIRTLGRRLRQMVAVAETLAFRDVAARLALLLAGYADQKGLPTADGTEVRLGRTREQLSQEIGTARESVSRAFKQLEQMGVIRLLGRDRVLIPSVERLRTLARPGERVRHD
jgi:CRP/FNR family transcriptional regulator